MKIGIIGGAGPLASSLLYETLVHESYSLGRPVPEIHLVNYPFTRGLTDEEGKANLQTIRDELSYCIHLLVESGVEEVILACNTLHLFLDRPSELPFQFHHLPEIVANAALKRGHNRLLILGTENTCHSRLYHIPGIQPVYPIPQDQKMINAIIDRVLKGEVLKKDAESVGSVIERAALSEEFDAVVLGCTDFPVLHHRYPIKSVKPLYDSIKTPANLIAGAQ